MDFSSSDWNRVLCELGVEPLVATRWCEAFESEVQPAKFSAGMVDILDFLPQVLHESAMLKHPEEKLGYSAERIAEVWPSRFPTVASAEPYAYHPQELANKVYGGRMGNNQPGDGWRYRGRSPIMLTGRDGYALLGDLMGQDLLGLPHLIEGPIYGLCCAVHWWENRIPDSFLSDQVKLRKRVNGGTVGLKHVQALADLTRKVLA